MRQDTSWCGVPESLHKSVVIPGKLTIELVAYLDDDNAMHPFWLKAVVWALSRRPDVDAVYGGIIVDDVQRARGGSGGRRREADRFEPF